MKGNYNRGKFRKKKQRQSCYRGRGLKKTGHSRNTWDRKKKNKEKKKKRRKKGKKKELRLER